MGKIQKKNCHVFLCAFIWNHPLVTCDRWQVTSNMWYVKCVTWHIKHELIYIYIYGLKQPGYILCLKLVIFCFSLSHFCHLFWNVTKTYLKLLLTLADSGWLWLSLANSGWLLMTLADSGWLWRTLADSNGLWRTARVSQSQPESLKVIQSRSESARVSQILLESARVLDRFWALADFLGALKN